MCAGTIFLIGMMGAGKSTVGKALARRLGREFIDTDHEIVGRTGVPIATIFEIEGEAGFRRRESAVLAELATRPGAVIATGGGAVISRENRRLMREAGLVVYLHATLERLHERTRRDSSRPLLASGDRRSKLGKLLEVRDPLYRETAHLILESGAPSAATLADRIADALRQLEANPPESNIMTPQSLKVDLGDRSYAIHVGPGLLARPSLFATHLGSRRAALVTNETVAPLYANTVESALGEAGASVVRITIPDGEAEKNWQTLDRVYGELLHARADRHTVLVALGGGVVGDLAGFAAATYQRGIPFIQVPTTLLAQVDSSVGGKTAINHSLGKNMIGAFHQPLAVIADTDTLSTLPDRELSAGLAEVVKYGAIRDLAFFTWLEESIERLRQRDPAALAWAIQRCCEIKAEVVALDEREAGPRALLNLGHTFGHAIETLEGYGTWLHGEAVSVGMVMAARLSVKLGRLAEEDAARIERLLGRAGLPVKPPSLSVEKWLDVMARDKKNDSGRITFILLGALGSAHVERNTPAEALEAILSGM